MKKYTLRKFILAVVSFYVTAVCYGAIEIDGIYYNLSEFDQTAEVTSGPWGCYSGSITIPSSVMWEGVMYPVTSIGYQAFRDSYDLTFITLPNSVTSIGNYAFVNCSGLSSIALPNSLTSISLQAFSNCSSLISILIPNSVTTIDDSAFAGCTNLESITVESGNPFYDSRNNCNAITVTSTNVLLTGCKNTIIPTTVTHIGDRAFLGCSDLTSISIPHSVTSIGYGAFMGCSSLSSIFLPNSVMSIDNEVFSRCPALESMTVESGNPFYDSRNGCNAIIETSTNVLIAGCKQTIIPESVTSIGYNAFYGCSDLTSIFIPKSVTSIGGFAFSYCSSLASIILPDSVKSIESGVFSGCSGLTSIALPASLTSIEYGAFMDCSALTCISLPDTVKSIGESAFMGCRSLTSIAIPDSVTSIEYETFYGCSALTSVTLPDTLMSIGNYAFEGCSSLASIVFPTSMMSIGRSTFAGCTSLKDVTSLAMIPPAVFDSSFEIKDMLHVLPEVKADYEIAEVWKDFFKIVGDADAGGSGIATIGGQDSRNDGVIYDLGGRRKNALSRGLNISDGKKILVK